VNKLYEKIIYTTENICHWQRRSGARLRSCRFADRLPLSAANARPKRVTQAINERNFHVRC